jgi:hypothetical protein
MVALVAPVTVTVRLIERSAVPRKNRACPPVT